MRDEMLIRVNKPAWGDGGIELLFGSKSESGMRHIVRPEDMKFTEMNPSATIVDPTMVMSTREAQALADQLYAAGIRPTEAAGSAGAMAATQEHIKALGAHLDDMRDNIKHQREMLDRPDWLPIPSS